MTIGVGILGFAHGHVGSYCTRWTKEPELDMKVVAGWDHNPERLAKAAETFGLQPYSSVDELLANPEVQAVVVSSETSMHADLVEKAAAAGKQIAVQKPISLTLAEADRIVEAVRRHNVPFTMAWQMRVDPQNVKMKELIESGELGKVFMVRRRHGLNTHHWPEFTTLWHNDPKYNRDIWADDSAHPIDFIHWLLGVPESVTAEVDTIFDPRVPNDNGVAIFRYPGGPIAEVSCSFTVVAAENTTEVIAENGSIVQNYGDVPSCNVPRPEGACGLKWYLWETKQWTCSDIASPPGHGHRIAGLAGPLSDFFHGKREAIATVEDGRTSLKMVLATYVSSREGRRVKLDDPAIAEV
jgi:predicted dehydrogenase